MKIIKVNATGKTPKTPCRQLVKNSALFMKPMLVKAVTKAILDSMIHAMVTPTINFAGFHSCQVTVFLMFDDSKIFIG